MHPPAPSPRAHEQHSIHRWRIPPPPAVRTPEAVAILQEVPPPLAVILWRTVRGINAWADVPPDGRETLVDETSSDRRRAAIRAAKAPPALVEPLQELALIPARPSRIHGARIGHSATRVARWAEVCGYMGTAAALYDAAARACPDEAAGALAAGRTAWTRGEAPVAEVWLQRAIGHARRTKESEIYTRAHLICAEILTHRGEMEAAEQHVTRARRRASRSRGRDAEEVAAGHIGAAESPEVQSALARKGCARTARPVKINTLAAIGPYHGRLHEVGEGGMPPGADEAVR